VVLVRGVDSTLVESRKWSVDHTAGLRTFFVVGFQRAVFASEREKYYDVRLQAVYMDLSIPSPG
jgi:hypothetical protein